jgi:hypothetical protein|uniref:Uncharacterized protein n=1 Tax=viral metagenome TaxID=1070528 RepID=A0A6C0IUE2_9ZZZZ
MSDPMATDMSDIEMSDPEEMSVSDTEDTTEVNKTKIGMKLKDICDDDLLDGLDRVTPETCLSISPVVTSVFVDACDAVKSGMTTLLENLPYDFVCVDDILSGLKEKLSIIELQEMVLYLERVRLAVL